MVKVPGAFTHVERDQLAALAAEIPPAVAVEVPPGPPPAGGGAEAGGKPRGGRTAIQGDDGERRARRYLERCEPAVAGEKGHGKTFKVACKVVAFDLPPEVAFRLLRDVYNPRCQPPWEDAELQHKVDDAYKAVSDKRRLLDAQPDHARSNGKAHHPPTPAVEADRGAGGISSATPPTIGRNGVHAAGEGDPPANEAPDDPHRLARAVLRSFRHHEGHALAWYREEFYVWQGGHYRADPGFRNRLVGMVKGEIDEENRRAIRAFREQAAADAIAPSPGRPARPPVAARVTRRLVTDVEQALASMTWIEADDDPPFWIEGRPGDAAPVALMPAANGLVDLDARGGPTLRAHTPRLFTTHALPYQYRADTPPPTAWLRFLDDVLGGDSPATRELQKWFGYALTPETKHQKILLLIGSPGSGRSTIKNVLTQVIGPRNVASTSAVALADRFGLEPLIGKTLAVLGDARTGDTHDTAVMLDRLLRISGEDPVEINRKGKSFLHDVRMRARLVILSNELPNFRDSSRAIVRRYLPICTPRSFEGRADPDLLPKLLAELPGILNWAIAGRAMLAEDGKFITPPSAEDLIDDAKALASPVAEFVAEECELGTDAETTVEALWAAWQAWASKNGHQPGHRHLFGRNLKAATGYAITTHRFRAGDARHRIYRGIGLRMTAADF